MSWDQTTAGPPNEGQRQPDFRPPTQLPPEPQRPGGSFLKGCLIAFLAVMGIFGLVVVGLVLVLVAGVMNVAGSVSAIPGVGEQVGGVALRERVIDQGALGAPRVAVIPVQGLLMGNGGDPLSVGPVRLLKAMLRKAEDDAAVRAVILNVDSGGGGVTASDVMHRAVMEFRGKSGKPVVVLMGNVAASGGYYVSCAADRIIAHPTTLTGSIGVLWPMLDASGLLAKIGMKDRTVKSGQFKGMGSPFAERTEEQWERERTVVASGRNMSIEDVAPLADGRIMTSRQAMEKGLVDGIGYLEDSVKAAAELAGLTVAPQVVQYERVPTMFEMLVASAGKTGGRIDLGGELRQRLEGRPMYLWAPPAPPKQ